MTDERIIGNGCGPLLVVRGPLRREVQPVLRIRLELVAFFAGISALSFWAAFAW